MPIDPNDSNYLDVKSYAIDTVTPSGWSIKYFVRDDNTKYDDLYIQWSKGSIKGVYQAEDVLQMRRYFIPEYRGENQNHIFLWHGCATGCQAILTLSKDSSPTAKDYLNIIDYDISTSKVVYLTNFNLEHEPSLEVAIVDLNSSKESKARFENLCMSAALKQSCIDTVVFSKDKVVIKATLIDKSDYHREKEVVEKKVVSFK